MVGLKITDTATPPRCMESRTAAATASSGDADLPPDWPLVPLGALCSFGNGVNADKSAYGKGTPFINVLEVITHTHLRAPHIPGRVRLPKSAREAFAIRRGDILFNRTSETQNEVGLAAVYNDDEPVVFGGFVIRGRFTSTRLDLTYAGYALRAPTVRSQIVSQGQGAIRANIGQENLKRVLVPIPSQTEQRAIASVLSDVDELIGSLEALLAKKRAIKQAAMQDLLTGRTRLPGFRGEWEKRAIGDISDIKNGGTPRTGVPSYWGGRIPWCVPTDITASQAKYVVATKRNITSKGLASCGATLLPAGALLLCSRATIGEVKIASIPVATNQGFKSLVCGESVEYEFLYYRLLTLKERMIDLATGSTFLEIGKRDVESLLIDLPPRPEQQAIATVLSDMDDEIAALERRLDKTRAIKQGAMQQLLTGSIRLPIADDGAPADDAGRAPKPCCANRGRTGTLAGPPAQGTGP